ncbi:hypothetical protein U9M48_013433 [Paspalum notatum var. saurae]|uniref:Uncharacterized protein n=1 Tax=Paspalum notatum var. saurae TaxID=547442 RepID=A0AAQ3WJK1_PASNO
MEARELRVQNASLRAKLAAAKDKEKAAWEMVRSTRIKYKEKMERMARRTRTEPKKPAKEKEERPAKRIRTEPEEPAKEERPAKKARTEPEEPAQDKEAEGCQSADLASLELDWSVFPPASEAFSNDVLDLSVFEMASHHSGNDGNVAPEAVAEGQGDNNLPAAVAVQNDNDPTATGAQSGSNGAESHTRTPQRTPPPPPNPIVELTQNLVRCIEGIAQKAPPP